MQELCTSEVEQQASEARFEPLTPASVEALVAQQDLQPGMTLATYEVPRG